jgi:hypothetical protein
MSYNGMEIDSPGTSEGHTEEGSTSKSGSNTKHSADGDAEVSEGVRRFSFEEISPDSSFTVLSPRRTQTDEFFGSPSYSRRWVGGDRPRLLRWPSKQTAPSYEAPLVSRTGAKSTEATVTELPGASVIQNVHARHLPAYELGNGVGAELEIDGGYKATTTIGTESIEPGAVELPATRYIQDKNHLPSPFIHRIRGGNPLQRDLATLPRLWGRVLLMMFHVLTHELYLPCCHVLTLFQVVLIILQEVPDTINTTPKWAKTHLATHYLLVAIFAIYTIDVVVRIAVIWPIVWQNFVNRRSSFRKIWSKSLSEEVRKYLNCLLLGVEDEIADNIIGKSSDSRNRSIWERYMDIFSPLARRKQLSQDRQESIMSGSIHEQLHIAFDVVVVMAFWISTALENHGFATNSTASAFRMVSSLRILTLLTISRGTQVHFRSAFLSKHVRIANCY